MGLTREAKSKTIKIYRRKQGSTKPDVLVANFEGIRKGTEKDLILQPFDIVEVGKLRRNLQTTYWILLSAPKSYSYRILGIGIHFFYYFLVFLVNDATPDL
jgi:hypothetical protein